MQEKAVRPKVYIETSIPSYLTARPSNDIRVAANQNATLEWWETRRSSFELCVSEFVIAEVSLGNPEAARKRLEIIAELPELSVTEEARTGYQLKPGQRRVRSTHHTPACLWCVERTLRNYRTVPP